MCIALVTGAGTPLLCPEDNTTECKSDSRLLADQTRKIHSHGALPGLCSAGDLTTVSFKHTVAHVDSGDHTTDAEASAMKRGGTHRFACKVFVQVKEFQCRGGWLADGWWEGGWLEWGEGRLEGGWDE